MTTTICVYKLTFESDLGELVKLNIPYCTPSLTNGTISNAMQEIMVLQPFDIEGELVRKVSAEKIETTTKDYDLNM